MKNNGLYRAQKLYCVVVLRRYVFGLRKESLLDWQNFVESDQGPMSLVNMYGWGCIISLYLKTSVGGVNAY